LTGEDPSLPRSNLDTLSAEFSRESTTDGAIALRSCVAFILSRESRLSVPTDAHRGVVTLTSASAGIIATALTRLLVSGLGGVDAR